MQKGLLPTQIGFKVQRSSFSEIFTQRQNIHHNVINYPILPLKHSHKAWDGEHESDIFYVSVQTFALSLLVVNNTGKDDLHTFFNILIRGILKVAFSPITLLGRKREMELN